MTYNGTNQKMEVLGNNSIRISGGQLKVEIVFKYNITQLKAPYETQLGTGIATALTDELTFVKQLRLENGNEFNYYLIDCPDIGWWHG